MSCFNNCYLPQPPRAWSRVQNSCSVVTDTDNNGLVIDPYTKQLVPRIVLAERIAMLNKGNVLQYKANSSNLTKSQKYSKIAKGQWINRNTTWATQSTRGYTNPNNTSLKRSGNVVNIAIDPITGAIIGPTTAPITCPQPFNIINEGLPFNINVSDVKEPNIPPLIEPTPGSETFPFIIPDAVVEPIVIQDEGILICSVKENVCTGETKSSLSQQLCHPTTASDVPGPIQDLCWNDGTQTWYPRQRYIMTNSDNKWPVNALLFSSVRPLPPIITSITSNFNVVTLIWTQSQDCLSVAFFNIFQDGNFVQSVPGIIFTADLIVNNCNTYNYFVIAVTNGSNVTSEPSNIVSIDINYLGGPPSNLVANIPTSQIIYLDWEPAIDYCGDITYKIFQNTILIGNTTDTKFNVTSLINCNTYTFSVLAIDTYGNETVPIQTTLQLLWPNPPTNLQYTTPASGTIKLTWEIPDPNCATADSYRIYFNSNTYNTSNLYYTFSGLINCSSYTFSVSSLDIYNNVSTSNTINNAVPLWPNPPTNLQYTTTASGTIYLTWEPPNPNCATADSYRIYFNSNTYNTSNLYYTFSGLINCSSYTFSVSSLDIYNNVSTSNTINNAVPLWPSPPTNLAASMSDSISIIILTWEPPNPNCSSPTSYTLYWSTNNITFNSIPNIPSNSTLYNFTGAIFDTTYYFYMVSVNLLGTSSPTPTINITTPFIYSITGDANFTESIIGNNYTLTFNTNSSSNGNFTLTFYVNLNNVMFTLVGGGGGGRGSAYYPENDPSLELLVGGVGGGGASSIKCSSNFVASLGDPNSLSLIVGKGGAGGLTTTGPPQASPGNTTSVTGIVGTIFYATAPGGKTSTSIGADSTTSLGTIYYAIGAAQSDPPDTGGAFIHTAIGGGSHNGSGIIYDSTPGQSNAHTDGGNGYNANNPSGNLPYGGGGGTNGMDDFTGDTFSGSVVSLNDIGGLQGTRLDNVYNAAYLPGNQSSSGYGTTQPPGFGSGGGGGGLYWRFNGSDFFGEGGAGGDGLLIVTFTYTP